MPTPTAHTPLSESEVRAIAKLARLAPTDAQIHSLRTELGDMLAMAAALTHADLQGVDPMTSPVESTNRLREDTPGPTLTPDQVTRLAPDTHPDHSLRVPPILSDASGA